jgi:hypothetical protein
MLIARGLWSCGGLVAFLGVALPEPQTPLLLTPDLSGPPFGSLYFPPILVAAEADPLVGRSGTRLADLLVPILGGAGSADSGVA